MKTFGLILLIFLFSCQTEIKDFKQVSSDSLITIEASFSNAEEKHRVYISYASPNITGVTDEIPVSGATVNITDEKGVKIVFQELEKGVYESAVIAGVSGNEYTLDITLEDGKHFQSSAEQMPEVREIKAIESGFSVKTNLAETDPQRLGFDVTLSFLDSPTEGQYYQWDWVHYARTVFCASCNNGYDYQKGACGESTDVLPIYELTNSIRPINYPCAENCFDVLRSAAFNIFADNLSNGQFISNVPIARVPFDGATDYYLQIEQRAITKKVYEYLRILKDATQNAGTMFDVPAITPLSPNIRCITNPEEKVLGVFSVYGVDKRIEFINRQTDTQGYSQLTKRYPGRSAIIPPGSPGGPVTPCIESRTRTKQTPKGWRIF